MSPLLVAQGHPFLRTLAHAEQLDAVSSVTSRHSLGPLRAVSALWSLLLPWSSEASVTEPSWSFSVGPALVAVPCPVSTLSPWPSQGLGLGLGGSCPQPSGGVMAGPGMLALLSRGSRERLLVQVRPWRR